MQGDAKVIEYLNRALKHELTAINQFFLHARMLEDWGLEKYNEKEYNESIEEMQHADKLIKRILFLEGLPNLQDLGKLLIGENVEEIIRNDRQIEIDALELYREAVGYCEQVQDYATRDLFSTLLAEEEEHLDWLDTQLERLQSMGRENFIQYWT
ncbi:bacterioferritin [Halofilum ochraceum]|uniref:bacterioferritin n=1 Tax=Halofilum ochraceum TaxID=1611323 RepID=UPI0008D943A8|nr:bacterioferritin [Halofilum ochraceum]